MATITYSLLTIRNPFALDGTQTNTLEEDVRIVRLANGTVFSVWERQPLSSAPSDVAGALVAPGATASQALTAVDGGLPNAQFDPSLALLANGRIVLALYDVVPGTANDRVRLRLLNGDGTPVAIEGSTAPVTISNLTGDHSQPEVAALFGGGFALAWLHSGTMRFSLYDNDGVALVAETAVTGANTSEVEIAALANGGFVAVWTEEGNSGGQPIDRMYFRRYDSAGVALDANPVQVGTSARTREFIEVVALPDGGFIIVNRDSLTGASVGDPTITEIALRSYTAAGVLRPEFNNSGITGFSTLFTGTSQTRPDVIQLPTGQLVVTFQEGAGIVAAVVDAASGAILYRQALTGSGLKPDTVAGLVSGAFITGFTDGGASFHAMLAEHQLVRSTVGNATAETLIGDGLADAISGAAGADTLRGEGGNDTLIGGSGRDTLTGGAGVDYFRYSAVNDSPTATPDLIIDFNTGEDVLDLFPLSLTGNAYVVIQQTPTRSVVQIDADANGVFEQTIELQSAINAVDVIAGVGFTVIAGAGDQVMRGSGRNDAIAGGDGNDQIAGGDGDDSLYGQGGNDVIYGQAGIDFVYGGSGSDTLIGEAGDDSLVGEDGDDSLFGGAGLDLMYGQDGNDGLYGGLDRDTLIGGAGADAIVGEEGNDLLFGDAGADLLVGGSGADIVYGGADADQLIGGDSADLLSGESGDDLLFGGQDNDILTGGDGADIGFGGIDNDTLYGRDGADTLSGEDGDDQLIGGLGADVLIGGSGRDRFFFETAGDSTAAAADLIVDFSVAQGDGISLQPVDANVNVAGDQAFVFVTGMLAAGQARLTYDSVNNRTLFEGEVNGDGVPDLVFLINGNVTSAANWTL